MQEHIDTNMHFITMCPDVQVMEGEERCGAEDQGQTGQDDGKGEARTGG